MRRLIAIFICSICMAGVPAAHAVPPLANGVGVHGPLTWGRTTAAHDAYITPVYAGEQYDLPVPVLQQVKAAGFDFVRLSIDPGPFLALQGHEKDALYSHLLDVIHAIRQCRLDVLVDFHPISMVSAYTPARIEANSNGMFDDYIAMVRHMARLLAKESAHIAIEPMNEPQLGYNPVEVLRWQRMTQQLYHAVRAESPDMVVVLSGGQGGSMEGLFNLDPAPFDAHTRYSFHYYLPFIFTHQGVESSNAPSRIWRYTVGLPYPAAPEGFVPFWSTIEARVDVDKKLSSADKIAVLATGKPQVSAYFAGSGTRAAIGKQFDQVTAWATSHHLATQQLFLGEFSATQQSMSNDGASAEDRAHWIHDVRQEAEQRGIRWAFWALYGKSASGMTLVSPTDPQHIDALTAQALGKTVAAQ